MAKELSTELRLVLAFALSFLIVMGSRYFLVKPTQPSQQKAPARQAKVETNPSPPSAEEKQSAPVALAGQVKQGAAEREVTVESDLYRIVFSTRGAVAKSWSLTKFRDDKNEPLNLIDPAAAQEFGYPLSF